MGKLSILKLMKVSHEVIHPTKFSKRQGLTGPQFLEGGCWEAGKKGVTFFRGGVAIFRSKNKLKSEIFNDKKRL